MAPLHRVLLFALAIAAVLITAAVSALLLWRLRGRPTPRGLRWLAGASRSLAGLGGLCLAWGLLIEADWLEVTRLTISTGKWPAGKRLRVALISDLHMDRESRAVARLAAVLSEEDVDLVVFAGDAINRADAAPLFRATLGGLPARLGRVAVRGNHDVFRWSAVDLFSGGVAHELLSDAPLLLDEGRLAICGAPFSAVEGVEACLRSTPAGALRLFVYHSPDLVERLEPRPDLYLAGHTHGGQVALPLYGALVTMSAFDKRYEAGRFQVGETTLYVNRGIGFEPHFPRVRFCARPELTLIDLVGSGR